MRLSKYNGGCYLFGFFCLFFFSFQTKHVVFFQLNRIHVSESCDLENVTALVKQYIPNVIFSGHSQYELRYKLPLENVNKFPGNVC